MGTGVGTGVGAGVGTGVGAGVGTGVGVATGAVAAGAWAPGALYRMEQALSISAASTSRVTGSSFFFILFTSLFK